MPKYKIGVTEGLTNLLTYITTNKKVVMYKDLVQYSIDYDCFIDLYMNLNLIDRLVIEHNKIVINAVKK